MRPTQGLDVGLAPQLVRVLGLGVLGEGALGQGQLAGGEARDLAALLHRVDAADVLGEVGAGRVRVVALVLSKVMVRTSAVNRLIGEFVQSRRRPLLGPSPG